MKKLFLTAAVLSAFTFTACDKNPIIDGPDPSIEVIEGKETSYNDLLSQIQTLEASINSMPDSPEKEALKAALEDMKLGLDESVKYLAEDVVGDNGLFGFDNFSIRSDTLRYSTTDWEGKPITLSGIVHFPLYKNKAMELSGMIVNCHATKPQVFSNIKVLQNLDFETIINTVYTMKAATSDGVMVVEPDYEGFGCSRSRHQTYLCHKLIAKQCADMLKPSLEYATKVKDKWGNNYTFSNDFATYIVGYSQGGGQALALTRYLTMEAPELMREINLQNTVCGAGPYDPELTFNTWVEKDEIGLSVLLPMVLKGFMVAHPDMIGTSLNDMKGYFSDFYNKSGIPEMVYNMTGGFLEGTLFDKDNANRNGFVEVHTILSENTMDPNQKMTKDLVNCLAYEQVCYDWTPVTPITLMSAKNDNKVPYENTYAAYEALHAKAPDLVKIHIWDETNDHMLAQLIYTAEITSGHFYKKQ